MWWESWWQVCIVLLVAGMAASLAGQGWRK